MALGSHDRLVIRVLFRGLVSVVWLICLGFCAPMDANDHGRSRLAQTRGSSACLTAQTADHAIIWRDVAEELADGDRLIFVICHTSWLMHSARIITTYGLRTSAVQVSCARSSADRASARSYRFLRPGAGKPFSNGYCL